MVKDGVNIFRDSTNLSEIYRQLLENESKNTSKIEHSPPNVWFNSDEDNYNVLSSEDEETLLNLEKLQRQSSSKIYSSSSYDSISVWTRSSVWL